MIQHKHADDVDDGDDGYDVEVEEDYEIEETLGLKLVILMQ